MFKKNDAPGIFYVFEGIDGAGKTTQAILLRDFLRKLGYKVVFFQTPNYKTESGRWIRKFFEGKIKASPMKLREFFTENLRECLDDIVIPVLELGGTVILDRYFWSNCAYGAGADHLDLDQLLEMSKDFILPERTFVINTLLATCLERLRKSKSAGSYTNYETMDKMRETRKIYLDLAKRFDFHLIDGNETKEEVFEKVRKNLLGM